MNRPRQNLCGLEDYLAAHDGPFFDLQMQLGLLTRRRLQSGRRIAVFVALAWGVPLVLSAVDGRAWSGPQAFLFDPRAWAKFFIAIAACILAEQQVERSLRTRLAQFTWAPLITPESLGDAAEATAKAMRRRRSGMAEAVCLLLAAVAAGYTTVHLMGSGTTSWAAEVTPQGVRATLAGWWCVVISVPLFWFLFLRGLWRHLILGLLLRDIARLDLRLVATHPDGRAGLAFIADYPSAFSIFVFGIATFLASGLVTGPGRPEIPGSVFLALAGTWLALVLIVFLLPLLAFTPPLSRLKMQTLRTTGPRATHFHRAAERRLLGHNVLADDDLALDADERTADPSAEFVAAKKLSVTLFSGAALMPVVVCALLPFAAAGADKLPFKEVLNIAKKLIVL